jgi:leucyl-tRNA synthetase
MERYEPAAVEARWQEIWEREQAFHVANPAPGEQGAPPKSYVLEMLPYPSGTLHMGHVLVYTLGDVLAHYRRRNGLRVLRPMGFDSFGLPAENAAIKEGVHPRVSTERNIASIRRSMQRLGWAIDWQRELSTHEPDYYRWTQWLFLRLLEAGLAERRQAPVKWCPNDQTVLANEQVKDGRCERCGAVVEARNLEQWFFRTTAYADALLDEMEQLDWPERILAMQRHWIGRSQGAEIEFDVVGLDERMPVFTTRPDTLYGATFFVLAPEHPLIERLIAGGEQEQAVRDYVRRTAAKTAVERVDPAHEKTGVFTGRHALNPASGERMPIWVADYVLTDYGSGAIMAVPAHDARDHEFAQRFGLPIRTVVVPEGGAPPAQGAFVEHGPGERLVDSGEFSGMPAEEGGRAIVAALEREGRGRSTVSYRLRDWLVSRQRYWGCPIPIVHCDGCGIVPVPEDELPVLLPEIDDYLPRGRSPLAAAEDWVRTTCPRCGGPGRREADTLDTFVDSSWYFLRYCDPHDAEAPFERRIVDYWCPVDQYTGGVDHTTMHLIYARFFVKALDDLGLVGFREPFSRFFGNGWVQMGGHKMSKSRGNVIGPDELVARYGADPVRLYILFIGPADQDMEWTEGGIEGMQRFVRRLWRVTHEVLDSAPADGPATGALARKAHATIARVSDDIGRRFSFNTAISAIMELVNEIARAPGDPAARFAAETAVSLVQPYAPHVACELWERLGGERLWEQPWPAADPAMLAAESVTYAVQVDGRLRGELTVPVDADRDAVLAGAREVPNVRAHIDGRAVTKEIVVPGRLVNLVTR